MRKTLMRAISLVLTIVMLCQIGPISAFADEESAPDDEIASSATIEEEKSPHEEKGDEESAQELQFADVIAEESGLREESAKHFRMSDGSFIAVQYDTTVHVKDENDNWIDIDNTLSMEKSSMMAADVDSISKYETGELPDAQRTAVPMVPVDAYVAQNTDRRVSFPSTLYDGTLYDIQDGRYRVRLSLGYLSQTAIVDAAVLPEVTPSATPVETAAPEESEVVAGDPTSDDYGISTETPSPIEEVSPSPDVTNTPAPEETPIPETPAPVTPIPETPVEPGNGEDHLGEPAPSAGETEEEISIPEEEPVPQDGQAEGAIEPIALETSTPVEQPQEEDIAPSVPDEAEDPAQQETNTPEEEQEVLSEEVEPASESESEPQEQLQELDVESAIRFGLENPVKFNKVQAAVDCPEAVPEQEDLEAEEETPQAEERDKGSLYDQISLPKLSSKLVYENAMDGVDIEYMLYGLDVKESIVIKEPLDSYTYVFSLDLGDLTPVHDKETGSILLMDGDELIYEMPAPYMFDAAGETSSSVVYGLEKAAGNQYILVVLADPHWINAENRAFPVTIDPTLFNKTANTDDPITTTHVFSGSPNSAQTDYQYLYVGYSSLSTGQYCQIYLNVNTLPEVPKNCVVTDAQIALACTDFSTTGVSSARLYAYETYNEHASEYSTRRNWIRYMTYNRRASRYDNALDCRTVYASDVNTYVSWDVVRAAQKWFLTRTDVTANHAIKLQATDLANYVVVRFNGYGTNSPAYFIVQYRNVVGLEDYYTYQSQSADRAGRVDINSFTQQLTVSHPDVALELGNMGVVVQHIYNSANRNTNASYDLSQGLHIRTFSSMKTGLGWKLSVQETIDWCYVDGTQYLVYNDPDGTEHYFVKNTSTGKWEDEDGLGLRCTVSSSDGVYTFYLIDKNGDVTKEFYNGYLTSITDSNGNHVYYAYGTNYASGSSSWKPSYSNHQLKQIVLCLNGQTGITVASFEYENGFLQSINEEYANRVTMFTYDESHRLTGITHPDNTTVTYTYDNNNCMTAIKDNESNYSLELTYTTNNTGGQIVSGVNEKNGETLGSAYSVTRDNPQKMHYRFAGPDRVLNNSDDLIVYNIFDYWGRAISSYTLDSTETKVLGAASSAYAVNSGTNSKNNHINSSAVSGVHSRNLLKDGGLEFSSTVNAWSVVSQECISSSSNDLSPHLGQKMFVLTGTQKAQQNVTLASGTTYTFSGYLNTKQMDLNSSAGPYLAILDSAGSEVKRSDVIDYRTVEGIDNGWEKISVTIHCETAGTYKVALCAGGMSGNVCGDDFQLEVGDCATGTNLVQGGTFNDDTYVSSSWLTSASDSYIYRTTSRYWEGKSLAISGTPGNTRWMYQKVNINQTGENKTFILSGWSRAESSAYPQYSSRVYALYAVFHYTDGTTENHRIDYNYSTTDWQYGSLAVTSKSPDKIINYIEVCMSYHYNCNTAWFDDISLVMEPCQSYTYDSDGNPIAVTDANGKTTAKYETGTNRLTEYKDLTGVKYKLEYDTHHNLSSTTSAGVIVTNTYDDPGNRTSVTTTGGTLELQSTSSYDSWSKLTSTTDVNGVSKSYSYDSAHRLSSSSDGSFTQNYTYNTANDRLTNTSGGGISLSYGYENGRLKTLSRVTDNKTQEYVITSDAFGKTTQISVSGYTVNGINYLAQYEYGVNNGHLNKLTYGNQAIINYSYDLFDRVVQQTYNDNDQTKYHYKYNAEGALVQQYETHGSDQNHIHTYDFEYDSLGRLIRSKETDSAGMVQRTQHIYDQANRLISQSWQIGNDSYTESYSYSTGDNADGTLQSMTTAAETTITYGYDNLKRLISESSAPYTRSYEYKDGTGGATTLLVKKLSYGNGIGALEYTYYDDGNIHSLTDGITGQNATYTYDARQQLTVATVGSHTYTYKYDNAGNITEIKDGNTVIYSLSYGNTAWADLLTSYTYAGNTYSFVYDGAGNPRKYPHGSQYYHMTWGKGRQLSNIADTENGTPWATYTYDMDGIRSSKTANGVTTNFITQNGLVVRQSDGTNTIDFFYDSQQRPYAMKIGNNVYYYILNLQGDVVGLIDSSGAWVAQYTYDPWGKIQKMTNAGGYPITDSDNPSEIGVINPLRYRGYYYDKESGFYYLQSRYYDPNIGRFINADAVIDGSLQGSTNLFEYCYNNPIMCTDSNGDSPTWWQWTISAAMCIGGVAMIATGVGGPLGGALLAAGVNSIIGGYLNESTGGSYTAGWVGGGAFGLLCGLTSGVSGYIYVSAAESTGIQSLLLTGGFLGASFFGGAASTGLGTVLTALIDKQSINWYGTLFTSLTVGLLNMFGGLGNAASIATSNCSNTISYCFLSSLIAVGTEMFCDMVSTSYSLSSSRHGSKTQISCGGGGGHYCMMLR